MEEFRALWNRGGCGDGHLLASMSLRTEGRLHKAVHPVSPSREAEQADLYEFYVSMVYRVSFRSMKAG